jgi:plastocyanin
LVLLTMGCGGSGGGDTGETPPADAAPPAAAAPTARSEGTLHEVRMLMTPDGQYVFQPAALYLKAGDRVRWLNVSGSPHNVAFYRDSVPRGAADFLNASMTERMGDLTGKLLFETGTAYEISFVGAPTGTYVYYCTPHEMLGMRAQLSVSR